MNRFAQVCFVAGTPLVMDLDGNSKPIEEIQVGEFVLARSEFDPAGPLEMKRVEELFTRLPPEGARGPTSADFGLSQSCWADSWCLTLTPSFALAKPVAHEVTHGELLLSKQIHYEVDCEIRHVPIVAARNAGW